MSKKIKIEEIAKRIFDVHGDTVKLDFSTYKDTHTKCKFIDSDFGEWWAVPKNVYQLKNGHPLKRGDKISKTKTLSIEYIEKRIKEKHNDSITLDRNTYINLTTKCKFIDKDLGEWWALPYTIVLEGCGHPKNGKKKREETIFKLYGCKNATQNREIALKAARSSSNRFIRYHWKTNEELICQASWEPKVVDYLNLNKIEYEWQPKVFIMPNSKTYRPDLYLINEDKWVEIKGYMRPYSQLKWDWFHKEYPNSELWNREKLKEMEIL